MVAVLWLLPPTVGGGRVAGGLLHSYCDPPGAVGEGANSEYLALFATMVGKEGVDEAAEVGSEPVFGFLDLEPVSDRESSRTRGFWTR
jgi:hypothetical protein